MELDLSKLNPAQKDAVITTEGPVMVMAGAGSGKTRVLTHRIAHLITDLGVPSTNILAVTFTNKAAREMKERISKLINSDTTYMWVSTFHSFCARLLRYEMDKMPPYTSRFNILDEDDAIGVLRDIIKELNIDTKFLKASYVKKCISNSKNLDNYSYPLEYKDQIEKIENRYNAILKRDNLLDFDDLIIMTINLFKEHPSVLQKYQSKFQYIMVDEFQDTNTKQYNLIYQLSSNHHNVFVVGDQDQSIYAFRGAKIENINHFRKDFLETKVILLERNYRSTSSILNIANEVINKNQNRIKKNLYTENNIGDKPIYYNADSSYDEIMFVIDKIKELKLSGYMNKDFAIMYRANALSRGFEDSLIRYQIPYTIYGGISFFSRKEVKDIVAYIRLITNYNDDFSFKRIVNEPKRKIGETLITKLQEVAYLKEISLFESIDFLEASGIGYTNLLAFKRMIIEIKEQLETIELKKIVDLINDKSGYYDMLKLQGEEGEERLENVKELKSVIDEADEFYEGTKLEKLEAMLSDIALRTDTDNQSDDDNKVKLMTYHQAKGLEFKVVFMVAMEEGIFPSSNSYTDDEQEEERRICYVGITRAMEKLYLTNAKSRSLYGQINYANPSKFIRDIKLSNLNCLNKKYNNTEFVKEVKTTRLEKFVEEVVLEKTDYNLGDKVNHKAFGDGLIVGVEGEVITVAFKAPYGIKKLISSHPSIRKLNK